MTVAPVLPQALTIPILMYHEIARRPDTRSRLAVSPARFAEQLELLRADGFRTVTAGQLAAALSDPAGQLAARLPGKTVALTFDDGFADFHRQALPLLSQFGFSATVFVTSGWVQDAGAHAAGRRPGAMLSWRQIAEAAAEGTEIAGHSRAHPQLDQLPERLLREELHSSKAELEDKLAVAVPGLAYPFGYSSPRVRQLARGLGYEYGYSVRNVLGPRADMFTLPRLTVRESMSLSTFARVVRGASLNLTYLRDRALTTGYAVVRRTRATAGRAARGD